MINISVLGAGSWGTALAILLGRNGHNVTLWSILEQEVNMLNEHREHVDKLPGVKLPDNIEVTLDLQAACTDKRLLYLR